MLGGSSGTLKLPIRRTRLTMFRHPRQLHRWACRLLVLWLFGIAVGVANACVVTDGMSAGAHQRFSAAVAGSEASGVAAGMVHQGAHQPDGGSPVDASDPGTATCQDHCVKSSASIPPLKAAGDAANGQGIAPAAFVAVLPIPKAREVQRWAPGLDSGNTLRIAIAFLRLAL